MAIIVHHRPAPDPFKVHWTSREPCWTHGNVVAGGDPPHCLAADLPCAECAREMAGAGVALVWLRIAGLGMCRFKTEAAAYNTMGVIGIAWAWRMVERQPEGLEQKALTEAFERAAKETVYGRRTRSACR